MKIEANSMALYYGNKMKEKRQYIDADRLVLKSLGFNTFKEKDTGKQTILWVKKGMEYQLLE